MAIQLSEFLANAQAFVSTPNSAFDAYAAWLAELGLADAAANLDGDDLLYWFDSGVMFANSTNTRTSWCTEGGLAIFDVAPTNEAKATLNLSPGYRMYGAVSASALLIATLDSGVSDRKTTDSRRANSADTYLFRFTVQNLSGVGGVINVAYRLRPAQIDVVVTNISAASARVMVFPTIDRIFSVGQVVAQDFTGTVAYTFHPTKRTVPVPVSVREDLHTRLVGFDPGKLKPALQENPVDLRDRFPRGLYGLPFDGQPSLNLANPWEFKGKGQIEGTVKKAAAPINTPVSRLVRLYREPTGLLVQSVWSDPLTGAYHFAGVSMRYRYTVISFDHTGAYRAVIADNITAELMP